MLGNYQHIIEELNLVTGTKGAFEFRVDDDLVYSKQTMQRRHAEPGELLALFEEIIGPDVPKYPQDN